MTGWLSRCAEPPDVPDVAGSASGKRMSYSAAETASAQQPTLPFPATKIGMNSNHGVKPVRKTPASPTRTWVTLVAERGARPCSQSGKFSGTTAKINQDRGVVSYPFCDDPQQMLLAVYDGHGLHGELVSEFATFTYVDLLEADVENLKSDPVECMRKNMVKCDDLIRKKRTVPSQDSGSTAIVALLSGNTITTACVGDSRCVKGTKGTGKEWVAKDLSVDQKPDDPKEKARIESQGGYVSKASDAYGPARVWKGGFGIGPGLAMSRSLGDHGVAEVGVTAEPEMVVDQIGKEDTVIILASDGVWEFISSQEAVAIVQAKHPNATAATKALIKESTARWKSAEGNYRDDITAIVVFLPIFEEIEKAARNSTKGKHTFVHDAEEADVSASRATDGGEIELQEQPPAAAEEAGGEPSPPGFIKRRLSIAAGMTAEGS
eukprot:Transcript_26156.p1 GENE.Transcript_26156~~Transcript_26156.p1  ORF type:complete len:435 (-),score=166.00 Transcript_26156:190-1494(-)